MSKPRGRYLGPTGFKQQDELQRSDQGGLLARAHTVLLAGPVPTGPMAAGTEKPAIKHRSFKLPSTVVMGAGIGRVPNLSEKRISAIQIDQTSGRSKKIIVTRWRGQALDFYSTDWEKKRYIRC